MSTFFTIVGGVSSFAAIVFSVWKYYGSRKIRIFANSFLKVTESGSFIASITTSNESQRSIEIRSIRFDIFSWNQSPKLKVHGFLKFQRALDLLHEREGTWFFPSDVAQTSNSDKIPCYLKPNQSMSIYINLDKMMEEHFIYGEGGHFENSLFFWISMRFLTICIETTAGKSFKLKAHREIKHYLYTKYKGDARILAYPVAKA